MGGIKPKIFEEFKIIFFKGDWDMNKVILMGRLTRDPEVRRNGNAVVANYTLAVDRRYGRKEGKNNNDTTDFISCVTFNSQAELVEKYMKQGTKILVTGRIETGSYTNRDGQKVYTTKVVVDEHEFTEKRSTGLQQDPNASRNGNNESGNDGYNPKGYMPNNGMPVNGYQNSGYQNGDYQGGVSYPTGNVSRVGYDGFMNIPDGLDEELPFN